MDAESERDCINYLIYSQWLCMMHHHNWHPIDEMRNLGVFKLLFLLLSNSPDWNHSGKPDTLKLVLELFRLTSVSPKVQLDLCETILIRKVPTQGIGFVILRFLKYVFVGLFQSDSGNCRGRHDF